MFQHTAARRRLERKEARLLVQQGFNTQPPEGGWPETPALISKPACFNTQPPEGGWCISGNILAIWCLFQHTAARRRLVGIKSFGSANFVVSTHSRPKAAGNCICNQYAGGFVSTHSRPKAAGKILDCQRPHKKVSTHSRPKAAGSFAPTLSRETWGFNTQPPEGGWLRRRRRCV